MIHFVVALALWLHVLFWGAGLAMIAMPRRWEKFWPVLVFPAGFALQSAVVWAGAYLGLRGTNSYVWFAEIMPLGLLAWALRRAGARGAGQALRRLTAPLSASAGCLLLLVLPLAFASKGLTTIALSSCDAADYAGGARTLMEFARAERGGFIGLTEVVTVHSVNNFFDYWLRLNHFTPAALMAFNGSALHCAAHEIGSLMTMVILAGSVPLVFWMARAVVGLRGNASMLVAVCYGLSPVTWYAVAQVSPGQLLAAQAIALVTWVGFAAWRRLTVETVRGALARFAGVLGIAYWLLLGSYNFFVLVCLVPAVAYAGGLALHQRAWRRLAGWTFVMAAPLVLCGGVFWPRVAALAERLMLLRSYDFGWKIPVLSPEGWLGFLRDADSLEPFPLAGRVAISVAMVALAVAALWRRGARAWRVVALVGPALAGYAYLQWRGAALGTNASYDAYKLLAVFLPGVLASSLVWLGGLGARRGRTGVWIGVVVVVFAHAQSVSHFFRALKTPPLQVAIELRDVRRIEAMPDVASVNVLLPDMWSRLWANALLLRKPQYFLTHTYEARLNTPLRGDWDLQAGLIAVRPAGGAREVTPHFALVDTRHAAFLRATLPPAERVAEGWHAEELLPGSLERWRWTSGEARLRVHNPHAYPVTLTCSLDARSVGERDLVLVREGAAGATDGVTPPVRVGAARARVSFAPLEIPPGDATLVLRSPQPPTVLPGDVRPLGVCVFQFLIEPRR